MTFTPYGFIKGTAEQDSSSPNGDDFPIPAGLMLLPGSNTGPNADPEFHMKSRQSRIGINLEWPGISEKLVLTGRFEADFEGNFNESDNADVTSIRNPNLRLRLAYARLDYRATDRTSLFSSEDRTGLSSAPRRCPTCSIPPGMLPLRRHLQPLAAVPFRGR